MEFLGHKRHSDEQTTTITRVYTPRFHALFVALLSLLLFIRGTEAAGLKAGRQRSALDKFSDREAQLVDPNVPSEPRMHLAQRDALTSTVIVTITRALLPSRALGISSTASAHGSGSATVAPSSSTSSSDPHSSSNSPLPQPFDTSLGNNFTNTACPNFFDSFLNDAAFQRCYPFSLLLQVHWTLLSLPRSPGEDTRRTFSDNKQTSNGFFTASRSLVRITRTLDASCNVDFNACSALMARLAAQLKAESVCGQDFEAANPAVIQALDGFIAYQPLYQAGCLKDDSGQYCMSTHIPC